MSTWTRIDEKKSSYFKKSSRGKKANSFYMKKCEEGLQNPEKRISDSQEQANNLTQNFLSRIKLCKYLTFPAASCNVVCGWPKCIALQTSGGAALLLLAGSRPLTTLLSSVQQNRISIIESRV